MSSPHLGTENLGKEHTSEWILIIPCNLSYNRDVCKVPQNQKGGWGLREDSKGYLEC